MEETIGVIPLAIPLPSGEAYRRQIEEHLAEGEFLRLKQKAVDLKAEHTKQRLTLQRRDIAFNDLKCKLRDIIPIAEESQELQKLVENLIADITDGRRQNKKAAKESPTLISMDKREITLSERIAKNLNTYGPQHHIRLSHSHLMLQPANKGVAPCRPGRFVWHVDKRPLKVLVAAIEQQYTVSKKETEQMKMEDKQKMVRVSIRIMGTPNPTNLYIVAKDLCLLIHIRKGNVAKAIAQFDDSEKARMPVLCCRSNGVLSTHVLTVLTLRGAERLLLSSQSRRAQYVHEWIMGHLQSLCCNRWMTTPGTFSFEDVNYCAEDYTKLDYLTAVAIPNEERQSETCT